MVWAATEGQAFRLRDGKEKSDPMVLVNGSPQPFEKLDESELRRLGGTAIHVFTTAAAAREFEKKQKAKATETGPRGKERVRLKTAMHNAAIHARRKSLPPEAASELAARVFRASPEAPLEQVVELALQALVKQLEEAEAERAARAPAAKLSKPPKATRAKADEADDEELEDDDDEGGGSDPS